MITSSLDVLYFALAVAAIVLTIFIAITLAYLIFILRDASKVVADLEEIIDRVNKVIVTPLKFINAVTSYIKPFLEKAARKK